MQSSGKSLPHPTDITSNSLLSDKISIIWDSRTVCLHIPENGENIITRILQYYRTSRFAVTVEGGTVKEATDNQKNFFKGETINPTGSTYYSFHQRYSSSSLP